MATRHSIIPTVVEQSTRGDRAFDIFSLLLKSPRHRVGMLNTAASSGPDGRAPRKIIQAVHWITAPSMRGCHPARSWTEETDARLCHRCRNGFGSGRCVGGSGAICRLRSGASPSTGSVRQIGAKPAASSGRSQPDLSTMGPSVSVQQLFSSHTTW